MNLIKPYRLHQVAKELHVSLTSLYDFLTSKGISIELSPNTLVLPDTYELLKQEFISKNNSNPEIINSEVNIKVEESISQYEIISDDSFYGLINQSKEIIVPCIYKSIRVIDDGYMIVSDDNFEGVIDKTGKEIIPLNYWEIYYLGDSLFNVKYGGDINHRGGDGIINGHGTIVIEPIYDYVLKYNRLLFGYINTNNEIVITYQYDKACNFEAGKAYVKLNNKFNYIDTYGNLLREWETISRTRHYNNSDNDNDWDRDTWNALTDGQYGDYPDARYDYDSFTDSLGM